MICQLLAWNRRKAFHAHKYIFAIFAKLTLIEMFLIKASIYICPSGLQNEMRVHVNASIVAAAGVQMI